MIKAILHFWLWWVLALALLLIAPLLLLGGLGAANAWNMLIALDQQANTLTRHGMPDETISARAWRRRNKARGRIAVRVIDTVLGKGHCEAAWVDEMRRAQLPELYRC